jgi:hypothetical protein
MTFSIEPNVFAGVVIALMFVLILRVVDRALERRDLYRASEERINEMLAKLAKERNEQYPPFRSPWDEV